MAWAKRHYFPGADQAIRAKGRDVIAGSKGHQLREEVAGYQALLEVRNSDIVPKNAYPGVINA